MVIKTKLDHAIEDPSFERKFSEELRALTLIDHPGRSRRARQWADSGRQALPSPHAEALLSKEELAVKQIQWNSERDLHWTVAANGEIVCDGKGVHAATAKDYADFELYIDWLTNHNGTPASPPQLPTSADMGP